MYRYIATDVDGTMLDSRHQLNSAALNTAIRSAAAAKRFLDRGQW